MNLERMWRRQRLRYRCMRKGHDYQSYLEPPYERCARCRRVPKHEHRSAAAPF